MQGIMPVRMDTESILSVRPDKIWHQSMLDTGRFIVDKLVNDLMTGT